MYCQEIHNFASQLNQEQLKIFKEVYFYMSQNMQDEMRTCAIKEIRRRDLDIEECLCGQPYEIVWRWIPQEWDQFPAQFYRICSACDDIDTLNL